MRVVKLTLLFAVLIVASCSKTEAPKVVERPKLPAIDPTDSTAGLGIRILTDGAKLIDTSMPMASKNTFRIELDSIDVIEMQRGGSSSFSVRTSPKNIQGDKIMLGWDEKNKYLELPVFEKDSTAGKLKFKIVLDSSIEPGLFQVFFAVIDSANRVSKHLRKWIVIGDKLVHTDSLIVGRWHCVQCNLEGDHRGHFMQLDTAGNFGEWFDLSYYKANPWVAFATALNGSETEPNFNDRYKVISDSLPLYLRDGSPNHSYGIHFLNQKKLALIENDHERKSFWVFARVHP